MLASVIELLLALICLATAGHLIIRLLDAQRDSGRSQDR